MRARGNPQQGLEAEQARLKAARVERLEEAFDTLEGVIDEVCGAASRGVAIAKTHLDTARLWIRDEMES